MKRFVLSVTIAAGLLTALAAAGTSAWAQGAPASPAVAQEHQHHASGDQAQNKNMAMHEQMLAEMKANDARLEALLANVNTASGEAKVDALTAVVGELISQRKAMHEQMMQGGMMCPMMQGVEASAEAGATRGKGMSCGMMGGRPKAKH